MSRRNYSNYSSQSVSASKPSFLFSGKDKSKFQDLEVEVRNKLSSTTDGGHPAVEFLFNEGWSTGSWTPYLLVTRPVDYTNIDQVEIDGIVTAITAEMRKAQNSRVDRWDAHNTKIYKMEAVCLEAINSCLEYKLRETLKVINDPIQLWDQLKTTYGPASSVNRDVPSRFIKFLTTRMHDDDTFYAHVEKLKKNAAAIQLPTVFMQALLQLSAPITLHPLPERFKDHVAYTIRQDLDEHATVQYLTNKDNVLITNKPRTCFNSRQPSNNDESCDWNVNFAALIEYAKIYGDCNAPEDFFFECDILSPSNHDSYIWYQGNLGQWLKLQHTQFRNGGWKHNTLKLSLFQELIAAGQLSWSEERKKKDEDSWFVHFAALEAYCLQHGDCNVPAKTVYECDIDWEKEYGATKRVSYKGKLGSWLDRQRRYNKTNAASLTPKRRSLLQSYVDCGKLNWSNHGGDKGSAVDFKTWLRCYAALIEYSKIHGHANIPQRREFECLLPADISDIKSLTAHLQDDISAKVTLPDSDSDHDYFFYNIDDSRYNNSDLLGSECDYIISCLTADDSFMSECTNTSSASGKTLSDWSGDDSDESSFSASDSVSVNDRDSCAKNLSFMTTNDATITSHESTDARRLYKGKLGKWLDHQRLAKKKRTLAAERCRLLEILVTNGLFTWEVNSHSSLKRKRTN